MVKQHSPKRGQTVILAKRRSDAQETLEATACRQFAELDDPAPMYAQAQAEEMQRGFTLGSAQN